MTDWEVTLTIVVPLVATAIPLLSRRTFTVDFVARRRVVRVLRQLVPSLNKSLGRLDTIPGTPWHVALVYVPLAAGVIASIAFALPDPTSPNYSEFILLMYVIVLFVQIMAARFANRFLPSTSTEEWAACAKFERCAGIVNLGRLLWETMIVGVVFTVLFAASRSTPILSYYEGSGFVLLVYDIMLFSYVIFSGNERIRRHLETRLFEATPAIKGNAIEMRVYSSDDATGLPSVEGSPASIGDQLVVRTRDGWQTEFPWWRVTRTALRVMTPESAP